MFHAPKIGIVKIFFELLIGDDIKRKRWGIVSGGKEGFLEAKRGYESFF